MENRIQIDGVWYVAEQTQVQPIVKTVDWMISKLQELSEAGYGNCEMTLDIDYGNEYDIVTSVDVLGGAGNYRVHIS
jgi:hypothetical protein